MKTAHPLTANVYKPHWRPTLLLILAFLIPGEFISLLFTPLGQSWWNALHKPAFAPLGWWVFPVVWLINYTVMGIAVMYIWPRRHEPVARTAITLFIVQLVLGFLWIPLVYGFHSILLGLLLDVGGLIIVVITTWMFRRINMQAVWWMLPYIAWLVYTMILKFAMWRLN